MREQANRVSVNRKSYLLRPLLCPHMGATIHLAQGTRAETAGQTERPAYQLDVSTEGVAVRVSNGIEEGLEHNANVIA
jgi:hypothetical protein